MGRHENDLIFLKFKKKKVSVSEKKVSAPIPKLDLGFGCTLFLFTNNWGHTTLRRGKSICRWTAWRLDSLGNELMIINFGWSTFTCLSFLPLSTLQIHSLHKIQFFTVTENQCTSSALSAYNCCPNAAECNLDAD